MVIEKLEDIANVTAGTSPKGELINSDGIGLPFFQGSKEFGELVPRPERYTEHPVRTASEGDVLVGVRAPVGKVNLSPFDCAIGRGVMAVTPKKQSDGKFLFYFLRYLEGKWDSLGSTGSIFENLSASVLRSVEIPKNLNRAKIGEVLYDLDLKIGNNKLLAQNLESTAQRIFRSWFIDFDPVKAKMEGEEPVGMDAETAALFPDSMEESELGEIPTGWQIQDFDYWAQIISGGTPKTSTDSFWNGNIPWFSVADAPSQGGVFFVKTAKRISEDGLKYSAANLVRPGVAILSARGTVGKVALVAKPSTFNQSCFGIEGKWGDAFNYLMVKSQVARLQGLAHGGMFDTITRETFKSLVFPFAGPKIFEAFNNVADPIFELIRNLQFQNETLGTLRDSLLPRLISGELEIPEEMLAA